MKLRGVSWPRRVTGTFYSMATVSHKRVTDIAVTLTVLGVLQVYWTVNPREATLVAGFFAGCNPGDKVYVTVNENGEIVGCGMAR